MHQPGEPGPPYFHLVETGAELTNAAVQTASRTGVFVAEVDGGRSRTTPDFFGQIGRAFQFPDYFGHNWNAVDECLADLNWAQADAYTLVVRDAWLLLSSEAPDERRLLWRILSRVAEEWKAPATVGASWAHGRIAFHVFLLGPREELPTMASEIEAVGCAAEIVYA